MFLLSWLVADNVRYYNKYSVLSANLMALRFTVPVECPTPRRLDPVSLDPVGRQGELMLPG